MQPSSLIGNLSRIGPLDFKSLLADVLFFHCSEGKHDFQFVRMLEVNFILFSPLVALHRWFVWRSGYASGECIRLICNACIPILSGHFRRFGWINGFRSLPKVAYELETWISSHVLVPTGPMEHLRCTDLSRGVVLTHGSTSGSWWNPTNFLQLRRIQLYVVPYRQTYIINVIHLGDSHGSTTPCFVIQPLYSKLESRVALTHVCS